MIVVKLTYQVSVNITFTRGEVNALMCCAGAHYDATCRAVAQRGGFVYGMAQRYAVKQLTEEVTEAFTATEIDLLMKVLEVARHISSEQGEALRRPLKAAFDKITAEWRRLND